MKTLLIPRLIPAIALVALLLGCDDDRRVVKVATEAADRQAQQNREIAQQNQQLAGATRAVVEADAQARKELVALQKDLQTQQAEIGRQRDTLEADRRTIAAERYWDPLLADAVSGLGILVACLLPLALAWQLLRALREEKEDPALSQFLITELATDHPRLLPVSDRRQPALCSEASPRLPFVADADESVG